MTDRLKGLAEAGVSIWLDDLSRDLLKSGELKNLVDQSRVTGVTTNPTIFAGAIVGSSAYVPQLARLEAASAGDALTELTTTDVRDACDVLAPTFERTGGVDGRVSIEVEPDLARRTDRTVSRAVELHRKVNRENVLIKIPATLEGLPAIAATIGKGVSVNVTLIFSLERYQAVMDAYLDGLERAKSSGLDLGRIHSVASLFVSRVDTQVDAELDRIGTSEALALKGRAAIANAQLVWAAYESTFSTERFAALERLGAHRQRPLWASTGVKDPAMPDTRYVTELVAPGTVNTLPRATLDAFADHGQVVGDVLTGKLGAAKTTMAALRQAGVDLDAVTERLELDGLNKFESSWDGLVAAIEDAMEGRV